MTEERTEGIVLRAWDYKERQRIINVLTLHCGVMSFIVKNISNKNTRLLAISTPFCRSELIYERGRSDLISLSEGSPIDEHLELRSQFSHLKAAGELVQAISLSQLPGKPAPALYLLLQGYLKQIPRFEKPEALVSSFLLKILKHEGLIALHEGGSQNFSESDWGLVHELMEVRDFSKLKELSVSEVLNAKIGNFFKEQALN